MKEITKEQIDIAKRIEKEDCGFMTMNCEYKDQLCPLEKDGKYNCSHYGSHKTAAKQFLLDSPWKKCSNCNNLKNPDHFKCEYIDIKNPCVCYSRWELKITDNPEKSCESCGHYMISISDCSMIDKKIWCGNYNEWTPKQERRDCSNCDDTCSNRSDMGINCVNWEKSNWIYLSKSEPLNICLNWNIDDYRCEKKYKSIWIPISFMGGWKMLINNILNGHRIRIRKKPIQTEHPLTHLFKKAVTDYQYTIIKKAEDEADIAIANFIKKLKEIQKDEN
jgi:hypothetical protein